MRLVGKKSYKIKGVVDFEWAPASDKEENDKKNKEELLSYWISEVGNQLARVTLLNIPSKEIVRTKNLVKVKDVSSSYKIKLLNVRFDIG
jgi:translation initiation factor 3 subunit B